MNTLSFNIGDKISKKSNKPFKKSETEDGHLKYDYIESFLINETDPLKREAALLKISKSVVNLHMLNKE